MNEHEIAEVLNLARKFNEITDSAYSYHVKTNLEAGFVLPDSFQGLIDSLIEDFDNECKTQLEINALLLSINRQILFPKIEKFFDLRSIESIFGGDIADELQEKIDQIIQSR